MASASVDELNYFFAENSSLAHDEFSVEHEISYSRQNRTFIGANLGAPELRMKTDLALIPSKLLDIMIDENVPPQNKYYDFMEEIDRESLEEAVSGKLKYAFFGQKIQFLIKFCTLFTISILKIKIRGKNLDFRLKLIQCNALNAYHQIVTFCDFLKFFRKLLTKNPTEVENFSNRLQFSENIIATIW